MKKSETIAWHRYSSRYLYVNWRLKLAIACDMKCRETGFCHESWGIDWSSNDVHVKLPQSINIECLDFLEARLPRNLENKLSMVHAYSHSIFSR